MTETNAVLLVYEDGRVQDGSAEYAAELARRQGGQLVVLMLAGPETDGGDEQRSLEQALQTIGDHGVTADGALRRGDKASEFVKFLAQSRRFATLVWGGRLSVLKGSSRARSAHWMHRVKDEASCPIVAPHSRRPG